MYDKYEQEWIGINKHPGKFGYFKKGNKDIDSQELKLYIPFHFWFCDNPGLYLPIIGITKHEVELHILTRSVEYLFNLDGQLAFTNTEPDVELWCDYIFLDEDEKRKFALEKKAYLIQQVQVYEKKMGTKASRVWLSSAQSRWGSCNNKNGLNLNWRLIMAPKGVIHSVVVHELAHTIKKDHSKAFWEIVYNHYPNYKKAKKWLKENELMLRWD